MLLQLESSTNGDYLVILISCCKGMTAPEGSTAYKYAVDTIKRFVEAGRASLGIESKWVWSNWDGLVEKSRVIIEFLWIFFWTTVICIPKYLYCCLLTSLRKMPVVHPTVILILQQHNPFACDRYACTDEYTRLVGINYWGLWGYGESNRDIIR